MFKRVRTERTRALETFSHAGRMMIDHRTIVTPTTPPARPRSNHGNGRGGRIDLEFKSSHPSHRQPNRANQPAKASQQKAGPASLTNKKERKKKGQASRNGKAESRASKLSSLGLPSPGSPPPLLTNETRPQAPFSSSTRFFFSPCFPNSFLFLFLIILNLSRGCVFLFLGLYPVS